MKINFRIIGKNEDEHSILVRYFTDILTEDMLANLFYDDGSIQKDQLGNPLRCRTDFNITLYTESNPSVDTIQDMILKTAPVTWLYLKEQALLNNTEVSLSNVNSLMYINNSFEQDPFSLPDEKTIRIVKPTISQNVPIDLLTGNTSIITNSIMPVDV